MTDSEKLFEKVKAKVEALKAAHNVPSLDISASTSEKTYPLERTIGNGQQACLGNLPNVFQNAEVIADADPLVSNRVQKLEDIKVCLSNLDILRSFKKDEAYQLVLSFSFFSKLFKYLAYPCWIQHMC